MTQHVENPTQYTFHRGIPLPVKVDGDNPIYNQLVHDYAARDLERAIGDPAGVQLVEAIHVRKRQQAAQEFRILPWLRGKS